MTCTPLGLTFPEKWRNNKHTQKSWGCVDSVFGWWAFPAPQKHSIFLHVADRGDRLTISSCRECLCSSSLTLQQPGRRKLWSVPTASLCRTKGRPSMPRGVRYCVLDVAILKSTVHILSGLHLLPTTPFLVDWSKQSHIPNLITPTRELLKWKWSAPRQTSLTSVHLWGSWH